jgi:PGF-pre-PGF domain-containing protein
MTDGSIVLTGGIDNSGNYKNDVWQSTDDGATWTQMTGNASWSGRWGHNSVGMPDGSLVLMGGGGTENKNDVWRSKDHGVTWIEINSSAEWSARGTFNSVVMPDGSIVLLGGISRGGIGVEYDVWRFNPVGSSAQNPVHTYTAPGTYQVTLQAYKASSYDSTRKAGYVTVYLTNDGGSDSGGDIPSPLTPTPTTTFIGKTITEMVNVGGGSAVSRAEINGTNLGKTLVVTAFPRNNLPSGIALTQTTVYQYLSIVSSTIPGIVDQVTLEFSVPQAWLTEHGFTAGDIVMMHYDNGQWHELDTRYISQNAGTVFYRATTPGFSYFAIVYQKDGTDMGTETPVPTTVPTQVEVLKAPVQQVPSPVEITVEKTQVVHKVPVTQPSGGIPMTTIIIGTTVAIATIIGTVFIRRWWIRKQNPTLFRKNDR